MTAYEDDPVDELRQLAAVEVPVNVDLPQVRREGHRRSQRRASTVALIVATCAVVIPIIAANAVGPTRSASPSSTVAETPSASASIRPGRQGRDWRWFEDPFAGWGLTKEGNVPSRPPSVSVGDFTAYLTPELGVGYAAGEGGDRSVSSFASILDRQNPRESLPRAGYVAFHFDRQMTQAGCGARLDVVAASGRSCRLLQTDRGAVAVIEMTGSEQGRVRSVVAEHGGVRSVVTQSTGWPQTSRSSTTADLVPWDGRNPYGSSYGTETPTHFPQLTEYPLTLSDQVSATWAQLGTNSPATDPPN